MLCTLTEPVLSRKHVPRNRPGRHTNHTRRVRVSVTSSSSSKPWTGLHTAHGATVAPDEAGDSSSHRLQAGLLRTLDGASETLAAGKFADTVKEDTPRGSAGRVGLAGQKRSQVQAAVRRAVGLHQ